MLDVLSNLWADVIDYMVGSRQDAFWVAVTMGLSAVVAAGYCVIAINWYFQERLARHEESRQTLRRLRNICLCCGLLGTTFYLTDMPWIVWRLYDACLLFFAWSCWSFVWRMRGLGLVDDCLAHVDELERTATQYRVIAELLPHVVWTANAQGSVDFGNQTWRDYAGDDRTWLEAVHPDERFRVLKTWNAAVAARAPITFEARLRSGRTGAGGGGGEVYRTFLIKATPITHGDAVKWLGACADIEDQKLLAAEKEMQARQKSFFLNALSHDLRAPLHNVLLNAQLLKMAHEAGEPADPESLDMIKENAVAAGDLVARLLDFAKVGAQEHNIVESVQMSALLNQIARRFLPVAEQKGLYVRTCEADEGVAAAQVQTDRQKLERIISNLVDNAIKYSSRGGVTLELVSRTTGGDGNGNGDGGGGIIVRVRDTGIGIPQDQVPYLFDEFYQVNNYERDRSKGFGMGLAICRSLARHIGADVRLAGTGAEGSCFEIVVGRDVGAENESRDVRHFAGGVDDHARRGGVGADRGGRPLGEAGDREDPAAAGLCGV